MADDQDDAQKTEEPTQKKLSDARERGEVPRSQDVVVLASLSAATFAILVWGSEAGKVFMDRFTSFLSQPHEMGASAGDMLNLAWHSVYAIAAIVGLPLGIMLAAGVGGNLVQAPLLFSGERMKIDLMKLSPGKGFGRLFGGEALASFVKSLLKLVCAGAAGIYAVWPDGGQLMSLVASDPRIVGAATISLLGKMLGAMLAVIAIFAAIDWVWQRMAFMRRMRMSKQDIKDEMKQSEGDPLVKMKIRQIRMERGRQRMMAAVPTATVIVTNPTHYAVALKYESGTMAAPRCVAKGVDALALRIRERGKENNVPIVENPPLARALYASVEVDADIPLEHYKAVAQLIGFIMRQRSRS